mmetsp:Transcript_12132/g.21631  ORF Transcript_12132/g.21631 Transcript_12132/m.21631 type:complete len:129 (-) Transcript_12132:88-474(-)
MDSQAQQKMQELRQQLGGEEPTQENMQKLEMKKRQEQEMKDEMLTRICTPGALDRIKRVALVKPEFAQMVEQRLLQAARSGQLKARVEEEQVKDLLEQASAAQAEKKVTIQRKTYFDDSDDDNDDDLL